MSLNITQINLKYLLIHIEYPSLKVVNIYTKCFTKFTNQSIRHQKILHISTELPALSKL